MRFRPTVEALPDRLAPSDLSGGPIDSGHQDPTPPVTEASGPSPLPANPPPPPAGPGTPPPPPTDPSLPPPA